jgi:hypothetical protein
MANRHGGQRGRSAAGSWGRELCRRATGFALTRVGIMLAVFTSDFAQGGPTHRLSSMKMERAMAIWPPPPDRHGPDLLGRATMPRKALTNAAGPSDLVSATTQGAEQYGFTCTGSALQKRCGISAASWGDLRCPQEQQKRPPGRAAAAQPPRQLALGISSQISRLPWRHSRRRHGDSRTSFRGLSTSGSLRTAGGGRHAEIDNPNCDRA